MTSLACDVSMIQLKTIQMNVSQSRNGLTDLENKCTVTKVKGGGEG